MAQEEQTEKCRNVLCWNVEAAFILLNICIISWEMKIYVEIPHTTYNINVYNAEECNTQFGVNQIPTL